jgi:ABC-type nitrate/sulfonate/bicarbonate transport system substrate-binding protein
MILATALLGVGAAASAAAETVTLRYGQIPSTVRGVSSLYTFIARQQGFFAREDIKLEYVPIAGGTDKMVAALDQGRLDVTQTATPYLIQAVLNGSDAVAIAGETANPIYSLIAKPEIASFADLKGKRIGLSLPVDTISISMRRLLALKGLREADYQVKELVGTPVRFDCLKRGECDAVPLGQPDDLIAVREGYRRLGDSTEAIAAFQFQVIAARRAWAQANKDSLVRFLRALGQSFRFIREPANRSAVIKAMVELTGSSDDIAR